MTIDIAFVRLLFLEILCWLPDELLGGFFKNGLSTRWSVVLKCAEDKKKECEGM